MVDASYDQETGRTGIGIVVHETDRPRRNGILLDQISECYTGIPPGFGEMLAVYRALEIGVERGFTVVKIRSDYNRMRKALKECYKQGKGDGRTDLQGSILRLANRYDSVHFGYKPRRKNQAPHNLAREAIIEKTPVHRADLIEICLKNEPKSAGTPLNNSIARDGCSRSFYVKGIEGRALRK